MDERDPRRSLRDLEAGLDRARQARDRDHPAVPRRDVGESRSALGLAFRISVELVVAVVVSVGIGWVLDRWLGTRPWGMVVFFFLGIGAGMVNVYRAILGLGPAIGYRRQGAPQAGSATRDGSEKSEKKDEG